MDVDHLIEEQIDYYRNRAVEYDETSRPVYDSLAEYWNELVAALDRFRPRGEVLEIASGTGTWTAELLRQASHVTALDSSSEMHEQARRKVNDDPRARFVHADVFSWKSDSKYDLVFFANWLSHVPPSRFDNFWETVGHALRPAGRVFFIDELRDALRHEDLQGDFVAAGETPVVHRSVRDGRRFRVVKVFWDPRDLESRLLQLGWQTHVHPTGPFFWADGRLTAEACPALLGIFGAGSDTAGALLLAAGDNPGRLRSEAAFAKLTGVSPVQASSGKTTRHRLNRGGDRHANAALHRIVLVRLRWRHPPTIDYIARRTAEGRSKREIIRCLKRYVAREVYRALTDARADISSEAWLLEASV